jgi:hypothetical protein
VTFGIPAFEILCSIWRHWPFYVEKEFRSADKYVTFGIPAFEILCSIWRHWPFYVEKEFRSADKYVTFGICSVREYLRGITNEGEKNVIEKPAILETEQKRYDLLPAALWLGLVKYGLRHGLRM